MIRDLTWSVWRSLKRNGFARTVKLCLHHALLLIQKGSPRAMKGAQEEIDFDQQYGVNTRAEIIPRKFTVHDGSALRGNRYATVLPSEFHQVMRSLEIRFEDYVFVDLGSGKGRVLVLASEYPFQEVIGVEHALELHEIAVENLSGYRSANRKCAYVQSMHLDAAQFSVPPRNTVFFLYNPFDAEVMKSVMSNFERSLDEHPRDVWLMFFHGSLHELAERSSRFARAWQKGEASVYRSTPRASAAANLGSETAAVA